MHQCTHCQKTFEKKRSLSAHRCSQQQNYFDEYLHEHKEAILFDYVNNKVSILELSLKYNLSYPQVRLFLKNENIPIETWTDPERRKRRVAKIKANWMEAYGVDNPSKLAHIKEKVQQTCKNRYGVSNGTNAPSSKIKHFILGTSVEPGHQDKFNKYRTEVSVLTKINIQQLIFEGICYYSGVNIHKTGPINDVFRASVDHKIPIIIGFNQNISAQEIASVNNLAWCARLMNTYKRAMTEEQFRASGIIERFKKYESHLRKTS